MVSVYCDTCSQRVEDGRDTVQAHVSFRIFNQFFTNNHFFINDSIPDFSLQRKDNDKASCCQRITNEIFFFRNLIPSLKLFFPGCNCHGRTVIIISTPRPPFLRKLLRWVLMSISQSLRRECGGARGAESRRGRRGGPPAGGASGGAPIHLALAAFWADLVTLPLPATFFSTALMTPTATV